MDQSPLTHQPRPEVFQPKIVQLYDELFGDDDFSEGFWAEFFLLRPDRRALRRHIDSLTAGELLALEGATRALFGRAVDVLTAAAAAATTAAAGAAAGIGSPSIGSTGRRSNGTSRSGSSTAPASVGINGGTPPRAAGPSVGASNAAVEHALATLTTFLSAALAKKFTNPSSDAIALLAGLDRVDAVLAAFVAALDHLLRYGRTSAVRAQAVDVALAVTAGAYQTTLLTYFIQRDLFPSIIKLILDTDTDVVAPFTLVGLLANYNKFEFQNPYQLRLTDFVNEAAIQTILRSVGSACRRLRGQYVAVQDDLPEGWTLASTLGLLGLGPRATPTTTATTMAAGSTASTPRTTPAPDAETAQQLFAELPGVEAPVLLATYDFTHANKLFCFNLVTMGGGNGGNGGNNKNSSTDENESPLASLISLASYLLQHAHRGTRTALYAHVCLMVFRLLVEDPALCKRLCSNEPDARIAVRLCRQKPPHLPLVTGKAARRPAAASVLDAVVGFLTHNLRRRLDVGLYTLGVGVLLRLVAHLARTRTRLAYTHWAELFRSLLGLVRFLTTYAADLHDLPRLPTLLDHVVNLVALALSAGEAFLPTPAAYDDLFYKVVETGDVLERFRDTYALARRPTNGIGTLLSVSAHYKQMLADGVLVKGGKGGRVKSGAGGSTAALTSLQVAEVIKQGYETLSIQAKEGLDSWDTYREADERMLLKKAARTAVADVKRYIEDSEI
ncbi:DUF1741 domain containing protein [Niveomyces insectorum RCEF 264]|uniref:DUF1741 domain containing protein n=1 Tax=Niveomyces insectorum RCEF 264 TaxID=1081102 RepID=A0A162IEX9_9HYPO|nr:DUF1741 domain containing protein [Niveomyces insectorum RCEF 264]